MSEVSGPEPFAHLLRLLATDAPAEYVHAVLADAEAAGHPDLDALREAVLAALGVRTLLSARRRREQELAALYETAGDLSSLRDVEAVLQAIVARARQLLGSDAAYLMQNDADRGLTRMRVTDGIGTGTFKRAVLDMGAGLGGLVAQTATPYATADYTADERFVHTIDDVVTGEGLVAILGVPLRLREQVIGVLFAANRHERPFSREEVALLVSLAHHAAIAIENASLFGDVASALEDLRQANEKVRAHSESVERAAAVHERLSDVMLGGGRLPEVVRAVADVLDVSVVVTDTAGRVLAGTGSAVDVVTVPAAGGGGGGGADEVAGERRLHPDLRQARSSRPARGTAQIDGPAALPVTMTPVVAATERIGDVVAVGRRLDEADVRTLERAVVVCALVLLQARAVEDAEQRVRGDFVDELLTTPHRNPEALRRRAAHLGVDLDRPHVIAVARPVVDDRVPATVRAAAGEVGLDGLAGQYRGDVVVLVPDGAASDLAKRLAERLGEVAGCPVTVGAAGPGSGAEDLVQLHRDAARCCEALLALDRVGDGGDPDDLGVYGLLFNESGREELARFVRRVAGPVLDHDRARGSDLAGTLLAYYASSGNHSRTAASLYVHVNTLYQRLERVGSLLGEDWRDGDTALQTHLALKIAAVLDIHA